MFWDTGSIFAKKKNKNIFKALCIGTFEKFRDKIGNFVILSIGTLQNSMFPSGILIQTAYKLVQFCVVYPLDQ